MPGHWSRPVGEVTEGQRGLVLMETLQSMLMHAKTQAAGIANVYQRNCDIPQKNGLENCYRIRQFNKITGWQGLFSQSLGPDLTLRVVILWGEIGWGREGTIELVLLLDYGMQSLGRKRVKKTSELLEQFPAQVFKHWTGKHICRV